jgi:hypothetical protein
MFYFRSNVLLSLDVVIFWAEAFVEFNLFLTFIIWGSQSDDCEDCCPLEKDVMKYDINVRTFWRNLLSRFLYCILIL